MHGEKRFEFGIKRGAGGKEMSMRTGAWETIEERGNKEKSKIFRKKVEKRKKSLGKAESVGKRKSSEKKIWCKGKRIYVCCRWTTIVYALKKRGSEYYSRAFTIVYRKEGTRVSFF